MAIFFVRGRHKLLIRVQLSRLELGPDVARLESCRIIRSNLECKPCVRDMESGHSIENEDKIKG